MNRGNNFMHKPTKEEFIKLAAKGNVIPVYKEVVADLETPVLQGFDQTLGGAGGRTAINRFREKNTE